MKNILFLRSLFLFFFLAFFSAAHTQIGDSIGYTDFRMVRLQQENDVYQYWLQSDKNFTNGLHFEAFHGIFDNKPADWFLLGFKKNNIDDFSLSIGQDLYTPEDIKTDEVDSTDRPYAALLYFTYTVSIVFLQHRCIIVILFCSVQ